MSSKQKAPEKDKAGDAAAPAGGSKRKLVLMVVIALVVIGGGVGGWLFMSKGRNAEGDKSGMHAEAAKGVEHAPAQYFKFDPAFVVNFGGPDNSRFLQVQVEAMTRDPAVVEVIKSNEPAIRNDLLLLFSAQTYDVLMSAEGKEKLRKSTAEAVRKVIAREGAKPEAVEDAFFTSFVIQ